MINDERLKRYTIGSLLFVALFAALVSYAHIRSLAIRHGYDQYTASILPFAVDGLMVGASFMLVTAARARLRAPLARCALWAGIAATLAANVAYGLPQGFEGATLAAWPGASFILIVEAWMQLAKRQRKQTAKRITPAKAKPPAEDKGIKPTRLTLPNLTRELDGLEPLPKVGVNGVHANGTNGIGANGTFPVPGIKAIKDEVGCGQPRAKEIQNVMRAEHISVAEAAERVPAKKRGRRAGATAVAAL